jgi:hypothetical protein
MSNQRNLKAFVRYDGSGRVVAGSLVLRKKKPKVGRWEEILTYECCGDSPTTTTTTTLDPRPRISLTACGPLLPYQEITIVNGNSICDNMIYITGDFSQLSGAPFYVNVGSSSRIFGAMGNQAYPSAPCTTCGGGTTSTTSTSTSTSSSTTTTSTTLPTINSFNGRGGITSGDACTGSSELETFYTTGQLQFGLYPQNGITIYFDANLTQLVTYAYVASPGIGLVFECNNGLLSNQSNC